MPKEKFDLLSGQALDKGQLSVQKSIKIIPEVQLSNDLFMVYKGSKGEWEKQAKEDEDFRNGAQWTSAQKTILAKRRQMPIVVNCIHPAVEQGKAMLTTHPPKFSVTGREDSDNKIARVISDMLGYVWDISAGNVELKIAIDDYYVTGLGWMMAYADMSKDSGNGEVCVRQIDPYDVFVDPNSKDIFCRDAAHILIVTEHTFEQLQRMYPMHTEAILSAKTNSGTHHPYSARSGNEGQTNMEDNDFYHEKYRVIDRYSRVKDIIFKVTELIDGKQRILDKEQYIQFLESPIVVVMGKNNAKVFIIEEDIQQAIEQFGQSGIFHYENQDGQPVVVPGPAEGLSANEIPDSTFEVIIGPAKEIIPQFPQGIQVQQVLKDAIQRCLSVGDVMIWHGILPIDDYPLVPLMNHHMRNPYPMSDVRMVRGLQEYVNKITSLIVAHASSSANVKVLLPRGSQNVKKLEEEFNKAGTAIIEFDADLGVPIIAQPIPLPSELYKNKEDAKAEIERIFGIYALMDGNPNDAPSTYKGTVALDEYGQRRIRSKKDDIESALNQLGRVVIQLMQKIYTRPKLVRIIQPNNISKDVQINQTYYDDLGNEINKFNDITTGRYDVQVVSGSMLPSNRWARFEYYLSLYEKGLIDQIEVLKQTEVVDMEGVLERMDILKQLQQQNGQMQEHIKKLEGDMQTYERESVHDRKRVEVEKFKSQLSGMLEQVRAASKLYDGRLNDELKRTKLDNSRKND